MNEQRSRLPAVVVLLVAALLAPLAYVLSVGPVAWLIDGGYIDPDRGEAAYLPLRLISEQSSTFARFLEWYADWWT
jgi:hypothetical protein